MGNKRKLGDDGETGDNNEEEQMAAEVKLTGDAIRKTGKGRSERKYYQAFELDGSRYSLEDSVLIAPEEKSKKPYVAIIKDIKQSVRDLSVVITGQWFYRPEEAEKRGGGCFEADDARELFYSFHRDDVPAESVMHKCVVYFIPSQKMSPTRENHPGFIVRKVYDAAEKKLWSLTDKDYEDSKQKELNLLVQKTQQELGDFVDMEIDEVRPETDNAEKVDSRLEKVDRPVRKGLRKKGVPVRPPSLIVSREEISAAPELDTPAEIPPLPTPTPGSDTPGAKPISLLRHSTGNSSRDKWVEKLLQSVEYLCKPKCPENAEKQDAGLFTAEEALEAICALEKATHESIGDIRKYNIKMRSLDYNLKHHRTLARRLLAKELDPSTVSTMTPVELKDGMTAAEKSAQEPQQPQVIQIASVRCAVCGEPQVGVKDIINAPHGDRYQLECPKCGNAWYSPRDVISSLTIETVKPSHPVGLTPWVTSKFDDSQKEIIASHEREAVKETVDSKAKEEAEQVEKKATEDGAVRGTLREEVDDRSAKDERRPEEQEQAKGEASMSLDAAGGAGDAAAGAAQDKAEVQEDAMDVESQEKVRGSDEHTGPTAIPAM